MVPKLKLLNILSVQKPLLTITACCAPANKSWFSKTNSVMLISFMVYEKNLFFFIYSVLPTSRHLKTNGANGNKCFTYITLYRHDLHCGNGIDVVFYALVLIILISLANLARGKTLSILNCIYNFINC